ncbi:MAG: DUF3375 domain-containing protein [Coriobacteriales bacterium]|jgi:hypothetical protein|nr:DUF3375 domain-containing protein [Coriobacteriales bacterium]
MSVVSMTHELLRLQGDQVAWKLLRAKNAPAIIAILDTHLGGNPRRLPVAELVSLVEADLEELRFLTNLEFNRSAQAYCDVWRADGYLVRRPVAQTRQETYELSGGALSAISFAKRLLQPHRNATQSRLNTIIEQVASLALATSYNEEHRRAALLEERRKIDEQLALLDNGKLEILESDQASERLSDILNLSQGIPDDFVRVRDDFEAINKELHARIINYEDGHQDILENIFNGVDEISQSVAGRSFRGFYSLLRDNALTEMVQDNIDAILDRDFAEELSADDRRFLRGLIRNFAISSQEVNTVMTSFARALRRFVQSQEYQQDRILRQHIDKTLVKAHSLIESLPDIKALGEPLYLTGISLQPLSRWKLDNPSEQRAAPIQEMDVAQTNVLSIAELRELARETEIDFSELVENVNKALAAAVREAEAAREAAAPKAEARRVAEAAREAAAPKAEAMREVANNAKCFIPSVSVADVLERFGASQGVASVVGLLVLAVEQGRSKEQTELVRWQTKQGDDRFAHVEKWEFYRKVKL